MGDFEFPVPRHSEINEYTARAIMKDLSNQLGGLVATMSRLTYAAVCRRVGDWWAIDVPDAQGVHTQARRLEQVEAMARDAVALLCNVPADSFDVTVEPHLDDEAELTLAASAEATRRAREAADTASRLQREAATTLVTRYRLTVRDTGMLLHVSPQRVSQLTHLAAQGVGDGPSGAVTAPRKAG